MITTFIYKSKNSNTKYYGKYIGFIPEDYEEGLDREIANIVYKILKDILLINDIEDLVIGILSFNRDSYDYFSEKEADIFDLLYCKWSYESTEIYIGGKLIKI
jgi:hypothetical protein